MYMHIKQLHDREKNCDIKRHNFFHELSHRNLIPGFYEKAFKFPTEENRFYFLFSIFFFLRSKARILFVGIGAFER